MLGVSAWLTSRIGTRSGPTCTFLEWGSGLIAASSTWAVAARNFGLAFMAFPTAGLPASGSRDSLTRRELRGTPTQGTIIIPGSMNLEQARNKLVEQQIRTWEVLDQDVLDLLYLVPREDFVPSQHKALAFSDMEIPIGEGERMWQPKLEARVVQELSLKKTDLVLEVGTGSGYLTALLSHRAGHVHSVEI